MALFKDLQSAFAALRDTKNYTRAARLISDAFDAIVGLLPAGGTTGQVLEKSSNADYDVEWATITIPSSPARGVVFGAAKAAGISTGKIKGYFTFDYAATITGWSLSADTGTITVKFWKVASGTAVPTAANSINTSGVSLSTGTHVRSSTVTDFTTTAITAGDTIAVNIESLTGTITDFAGTLEVQPT